MNVIDKLKIVNENIENACINAGRRREDIDIIAVTKYVSVERAQETLDAGIVALGENRDNELIAKYEKLGDKPVWHFIGSLQTRKVRDIIDKVTYVHSLDRISLVQEINKRVDEPMKCFIQVNVSGETSKHGLEPDKLISFVQEIEQYPNVKVVGLMTMAPHIGDKTIIRNCFKTLKQLQIKVQELNLAYAPCNELSMGMSNDYEIAIEEGATLVRIGSSLVGE